MMGFSFRDSLNVQPIETAPIAQHRFKLDYKFVRKAQSQVSNQEQSPRSYQPKAYSDSITTRRIQ